MIACAAENRDSELASDEKKVDAALDRIASDVVPGPVASTDRDVTPPPNGLIDDLGFESVRDSVEIVGCPGRAVGRKRQASDQRVIDAARIELAMDLEECSRTSIASFRRRLGAAPGLFALVELGELR
ncbi:MAG TPA: hypothetical protein VFT98_07345, partial [Myxococcota bacterium]|nr:hypothetical protein [Myxococcota bacterium]